MSAVRNEKYFLTDHKRCKQAKKTRVSIAEIETIPTIFLFLMLFWAEDKQNHPLRLYIIGFPIYKNDFESSARLV